MASNTRTGLQNRTSLLEGNVRTKPWKKSKESVSSCYIHKLRFCSHKRVYGIYIEINTGLTVCLFKRLQSQHTAFPVLCPLPIPLENLVTRESAKNRPISKSIKKTVLSHKIVQNSTYYWNLIKHQPIETPLAFGQQFQNHKYP